MITSKEKALELVHKYIDLTGGWVAGTTGWKYKKQCALIAVDELIEDNKSNEEVVNRGLNKSFWEQVKQEIELL
jgi:hypothetical protein